MPLAEEATTQTVTEESIESQQPQSHPPSLFFHRKLFLNFISLKNKNLKSVCLCCVVHHIDLCAAKGQLAKKAKMRSMASSTSCRSIAAIVGVGPKLGRSIARKFAHEGYTVAILARDLGRLSRFADEIAREEKAQVFAIRIDCSDSRSVREAFEGVLSLGFVEVLVYNAYQPVSWHPTTFTEIRSDSFEKSVAISSVGAFLCAQQVLPGMVERGKGTILFTGCAASLSGMAGFSELCCGKFALRALSQCLAREFHPLGVHVAHVVIDGIVGTPREPITSQRPLLGEQQQSGGGGGGDGSMLMMDPDSLAQTFWHVHVQDRTAWTQEIDLRPSNPRLFY